MARSRCLCPAASLVLLLAAGCQPAPGDTDQAGAEPEILGATESSREFGDYVLHFNALTTDQLDTDIAASYGIVRSRNRVMLNVNVQRRAENGATTAVAADISASAANLNGQLKELSIGEIRDGDAIYYIATTSVINGETLIFTIEATPESEETPLTVRFQKQFFVDE